MKRNAALDAGQILMGQLERTYNVIETWRWQLDEEIKVIREWLRNSATHKDGIEMDEVPFAPR